MSTHSPKNRFRCEINFKSAIPQIGSVESFTASTLEEVKSGISQRNNNITRGNGAYIAIMENNKAYPEFDWEVIERIEL